MHYCPVHTSPECSRCQVNSELTLGLSKTLQTKDADDLRNLKDEPLLVVVGGGEVEISTAQFKNRFFVHRFEGRTTNSCSCAGGGEVTISTA